MRLTCISMYIVGSLLQGPGCSPLENRGATPPPLEWAELGLRGGIGLLEIWLRPLWLVLTSVMCYVFDLMFVV